MAYAKSIDYETVSRLLRYDPETGGMRWLVSRGGIVAGSDAGCVQCVGRTRRPMKAVRINDRLYGFHNIAWLLHYGAWPSLLVDHRNGDATDNRISNLRMATPQQNAQNTRRRRDNHSGYKGVSWDRVNSKWVARIRQPNGIYRNLGRFATAEMAHDAYCGAAVTLFGEFARVA